MTCLPIATQTEAEAGVVNDKSMTPLRTKQAIDALGVSQTVLASPTGGEMVGFEQTGTGTVERDMLDKARETISVEDFYRGTSDDAVAWQRALHRIHALGGGTLVATKPAYFLSDELVLDGTSLDGCVVIDARGAVMTTQAGVPGVLAIEGNSNLCGIQVRNMVVDHTANTTALYAFRQQGTARVSWARCYVRGSDDLPVGYGAWLLKQADPDDNNTANFWTNFAGSGCRGDFGPIPNAAILEGANNQTDFNHFHSSNCGNHILMRAPTGTTLAPNLQPIGGNSVNLRGAAIEQGTNGVLFQGVSGGYGPQGLVIDCRAEDITNLLNIQGATLDHAQGPIVYAEQILPSVVNLVVNPNSRIISILDYRNSGGPSIVPTSGGWRFKGLDNTKDVLDIDMPNIGTCGLRWGVNGAEAASARYVTSGVMELKADPSDNVGWAFSQIIGLSASNIRARNFMVSGTFTAGTTATVTFATAEVDDKFEVMPFATQNTTLWATSKTTAGFTLNSSASITGRIYCAIVRRR